MDGDKLFMSASVSTGNKTTPTPKGTFSIFRKTPSRYMQGPLPGISKQYFDLPGVPWTMYFTEQGAAIHGAYWHSDFGATHSNGCVNLPVAKARQLYTWADVGTKVVVRQ
jgi:lipoprotein-anchoring transpeptidase ErfK/SrfK